MDSPGVFKSQLEIDGDRRPLLQSSLDRSHSSGKKVLPEINERSSGGPDEGQPFTAEGKSAGRIEGVVEAPKQGR